MPRENESAPDGNLTLAQFGQAVKRKFLLILGLLAACSPAFGQCTSPCLVAATGVTGSGTSRAITINGLTAGKTVIVNTWFRNVPGTASISSDTCTSSWTQDYQDTAGIHGIAVFRATVPVGCVNDTITVGYNFSTNANYVMATEWDSFAASPFDASATGSYGGTWMTRMDTLSTVLTAQANEIWLAAVGTTVSGAFSLPGYTTLDSGSAGKGTYYQNVSQIAGARAVVNVAPSTSNNGQGIIAVVAYKLATAGTDNGSTVHSSGAISTTGGVSLSGSRTITTGTTYADWSGIDAMSPGTSRDASVGVAGERVGSSNWQWNFSGVLNTTKYTIVTNGTDSLCPNNGHNCMALEYVTNAGTTNYANYIYVSPTYSGWSGDPSQQATDDSTAGVWFQFYVAVDANTTSYMGNTNAQVKFLHQLYDAGGSYQKAATNGQSDGGGGFWMVVENTASGNSITVQDNVLTGGVFQVNKTGILTTPGVLVKGHFWRNTATREGHAQASINGAEIVNTEAQEGLVSPQFNGGSFRLGTNTGGGNVMGWPLGIRYFQACSNACANTTLHVVLQNAKLCNYNCVGYP